MQDTYILVGCVNVVGRVITFRGTIRFEESRDILSMNADTKGVFGRFWPFLASCNSNGLSIPERMSQNIPIINRVLAIQSV